MFPNVNDGSCEVGSLEEVDDGLGNVLRCQKGIGVFFWKIGMAHGGVCPLGDECVDVEISSFFCETLRELDDCRFRSGVDRDIFFSSDIRGRGDINDMGARF